MTSLRRPWILGAVVLALVVAGFAVDWRDRQVGVPEAASDAPTEVGHVEGKQTSPALIGGAARMLASQPPASSATSASPADSADLEQALAISGRVLDAMGRPIPNLRLEADLDIGYGKPYPAGRPAAITAADGRFRLVGLWAGSHDLQWIDPPQGRVLLGPWGIDAGTEGVELRVVEARGLTGTVRSQVGAPIASLRVGLGIRGDAPYDRHLSTRTAADGSFHFGGIAPGAVCVVSVKAQDLGNEVWLGAGPFDVHDTEQALAIVLEQGASLAGRVRCVPPAHFSETEVQIEPHLGGDAETGMAHEDGSFLFAPLVRGTYWVRARHVAGVWGEPKAVEVPAADLDLVVELPPALEGTLLRLPDYPFIRFVAGSQTCEIDEPNGQFCFYPPPGAVGTLFAHDCTNGRYALQWGATATGGPYELVWQPGSEISGSLPEDLRYAPDAYSVGAFNELGYLRGTIDSHSRTFVIRGVPPGTWNVSARIWGRPTLRFGASGVRAGSTDVMLVPK